MVDKELKKLNVARGQCRGSVTRAETFVTNTPEKITLEDIIVRTNHLKEIFGKHQEIMVQLMALDDKVEEDDFEDRVMKCLSTMERLAKRFDTKSSNIGEVHSAKLPHLDIPTFDGKNIAEYKPFMEMFQAVVHKDFHISDVQRLCFLKKYLQNEPLQIIDSLPIVGDSYTTALSLLKKRYDNPVILINGHVSSLLDLPSLHRGTAQQLRELVAKVRQQIAALKNLSQPVQHWDTILFCIITRKLDPLTVRLYYSERDPASLPTMDGLLEYLDKRASSLEASPMTDKSRCKVVNVTTDCKNEQRVFSCKLCSQNHKLYKCPKFLMMTTNKRFDYVSKNNLCKICLCFHDKRCRLHLKCSICQATSHNGLIHTEQNQVDASLTPLPKQSNASLAYNDKKQDLEEGQVNLHSSKVQSYVLLPTAKVLVTDSKNNKFVVRALLDSGSQTSFCTTSLASRLHVHSFDSPKRIFTLGENINKADKAVSLKLDSLTENFSIKVTCSLVEKITVNLPQQHFNANNLIIPKSIALADNEYNVSGEISLLLAADVFFRIVCNGKIESGPGDPILLNTRFGYIVAGDVSSGSNCGMSVSMHAIEGNNLDFYVKRFWETEKVPEVVLESIPEHEYSEMIFKESVILNNKRFEVKLPIKLNKEDLNVSDSFSLALRRFYSLEKRFKRDTLYYNLYVNFINEYLALGHAKVIDVSSCHSSEQPLYYLPHHAVLRMDKTTNKLRVVFDGSATTKNNPSLNEILCNGPVVQKSLFEILLLFRTHKYVIICDIRHMYRQINLNPEDRVLQNILWRERPEDPVQCLQLKTVTYGLTSSAFLATRCLVELATRYKQQFKLASEAILNMSYCDDVLCGSNTLQDAIQLKRELISLMELGSFQLHKWSSNKSCILADMPQTELDYKEKDFDQGQILIKTLGMSYDTRNDVFKMSGNVVTSPDIPTKRTILSSVSRLFDPLGFAGPVIVRAKLILQQIWERNLGWDAPLPPEILDIWNNFHVSLSSMSDIIIPRDIKLSEACDVELIGYCDASSEAYGCCIYLKVKLQDKYVVNILTSKSRVAPLGSKLTIPKLELNGALILAKLMHKVAHTLCNIKNITLFCDSKIVLGWLACEPMKLPAYISNRVRAIMKCTNQMLWRYTPGLANPADILSRGENPHDIIKNKMWWHGPDYLLESNSYNFHLAEIELPLEDVTCFYTSNTIKEKYLLPVLTKISNLNKLQRIMCYVLRFIKIKCSRQPVLKGNLTVKELNNALHTIIRCYQHSIFELEIHCIKNNKPISSKNCCYVRSLNPFLDEFGLLRVGGRLDNTSLPYPKKFPIILPKKCHLTRLIIVWEHLLSLHGGLKLLLSSLSQRYYIVNSIREVKSVIYKCTVCCRLKAEGAQQLMGSLPKERVTPARPFERVGVDYCGPFEMKESTIRRSVVSKGYVVVFVCFASKATHLEVVSNMSSASFLAALKRFISRRGLPGSIYCDNAKTFKGADNELKIMYKELGNSNFQNDIIDYASMRGIQFNYIPAYSPNHGGLWEAAVKSTKYHFKRIIGARVFTYEQLATIIIEIEGILNSRPISPMSQDLSDFSYLTPGHFLIGCSINSYPQPNLTDVPSNRLKFWRCCEQIRQHFWRAWSKDYLSSLNKRSKWQQPHPNLREGMVVLLKDLNTPPLQWPLGRISETHKGSDGRVRIISVKTADHKIHSRAVSKVVVLPIEI